MSVVNLDLLKEKPGQMCSLVRSESLENLVTLPWWRHLGNILCQMPQGAGLLG